MNSKLSHIFAIRKGSSNWWDENLGGYQLNEKLLGVSQPYGKPFYKYENSENIVKNSNIQYEYYRIIQIFQ